MSGTTTRIPLVTDSTQQRIFGGVDDFLYYDSTLLSPFDPFLCFSVPLLSSPFFSALQRPGSFFLSSRYTWPKPRAGNYCAQQSYTFLPNPKPNG